MDCEGQRRGLEGREGHRGSLKEQPRRLQGLEGRQRHFKPFFSRFLPIYTTYLEKCGYVLCRPCMYVHVTCRCLEGREDRGGRLQGCEDTATFFPDSQCRCREPDDFEFENARNRRVPCIVPFQSVVCKSSFAMRVHHSALGIWYVLLTRI